MSEARSLDQAYFDGLYAADPDPWRFATSPYEREKYRVTMAALEPERARRALEVGCSIGVLTEMLAGLCDSLVAVDFCDVALAQARMRCKAFSSVDVRRARLPQQMPGGAFDLIILSEVAYYWSSDDLGSIAKAIDRQLIAGGRLLLVHWTGGTNYPKTADAAVEELRNALLPTVAIEREARHTKYRLDLWRRL